ncbi:MAG TPA: tryptophan synthase subunit alpha [Candidatus Aminicenantes bacterium]|nr:tryptophan synthase subunit alpha [Candidatus Aminicenantes bacterium]
MVNAIDQAFQKRRRTLLMTHVVAGYPSLAGSAELVVAMAAAGADMVEIQIPFSDPLADGPTIMAANQVALKNGTRPEDVFCMVEELKSHVKSPLLLMTYANIPFRLGWHKFASSCKRCGAAGAIVPDLPYDEKGNGLRSAMRRRGLHFIEVVSPGISSARLAVITAGASGFLYLTLRIGVTGAVPGLENRGTHFLEQLKSFCRLPLATGFGISTFAHLAALKDKSDALVIGSRLIDLHREQGTAAVVRFVGECRSRLETV